jgi:serine-type D-Ala-D-Ala carboxypeptidase/endopeptidase (penicillin-binding protein 4)
MKKTLLFKLPQLIKGLIIIFLMIACKAPKTIQQKVDVNTILVDKPQNNFDSLFKNAHVGISVYDEEKKSFLASYQSYKYFIPASNLKIFTCYAALKYLGDSLIGLNYFEDDSSIQIQGTGDPTFLNTNFNNQPVYHWLKSKSNKKIYLLDTKFNTTAYANGWSWDDYLEPFMAERNSFPMYENTVKFYNSNGLKAVPNYFENKITSSFEASDNSLQFKVNRKIGSNEFVVNPGKNSSQKISFSTEVDNPILHNKQIAKLLSDTLHKTILSKPVFSNSLLNKVYTQAKNEVLKSMMYRSDNFIAEQILLMVSNELFKEMDETKLIQYLLNNDLNELPQLPKWVDGSGLSRYNLITPEDFVFMLNKMKNEFGWQKISNIFPKGNEGTLKNMFINNANQIFAKTGTLSNNFCISGYLKSNAGKEFTFSIMVNNHMQKTAEIKKIIENYLTEIIVNN